MEGKLVLLEFIVVSKNIVEKLNNIVRLICEDIDKYRFERDVVSVKLEVVIELIEVDRDIVKSEV